MQGKTGRGSNIRIAAALVALGEAAGLRFQVRPDEVRMFHDGDGPAPLALVEEIERQQQAVVGFLRARDLPDDSNLIQLWKADPKLRAEWPGGIVEWLQAGEGDVAALLEVLLQTTTKKRGGSNARVDQRQAS